MAGYLVLGLGWVAARVCHMAGSQVCGQIQTQSDKSASYTNGQHAEGEREVDQIEYTVELDRVPGIQLGIHIDCKEGDDATYVLSVEDGLVQTWNNSHSLQVTAGDVLLEVNGKGGSLDSMLERCRTEQHLVLKLRKTKLSGKGNLSGKESIDDVTSKDRKSHRSETLSVELEAKPGMSLGVEGQVLEQDVLEIESVVAGGLVDRWNSTHPSKQVRAGDVIVAVNGTHARGTELLGMLGNFHSGNLTLTITRLLQPEPSAKVPTNGEVPPGNLHGASASASASASPPRTAELDPTSAAEFLDPRSMWGGRVGIVAFSETLANDGFAEACSRACGSSFLANSHDLGPGGLRLTAPCDKRKRCPFRNAEAAFQATMFWPLAAQFKELSSQAALTKVQRYGSHKDPTCAGFGSAWHSMQAVLLKKFTDTDCGKALLKTGDAFLVTCEDDTIQAKPFDNWLGLQLMLCRDRLSGKSKWSDYFQIFVELRTGEGRSASALRRWQDVVKSARGVLEEELSAETAET